MKRLNEKLNVYLDNCCFNRPFDDQNFLKIRLETEAKLFVQSLIRAGQVSLVWSYVLDYENSANPCDERRLEIQRWKDLSAFQIEETPDVLEGMRDGIAKGLGPLDALHVACAYEMDCDTFLTVDKGILKKAKCFSGIRIISPVNFIMEWESEDVS